jgi:hypothetical protein
LRSTRFGWHKVSIFHDAGLQPLANQAEDATIADTVLDETVQPLMAGDTRGRVLTVTARPSSVAQRSFRRQTPEVGARCVNHARRDLCGGCAAMRIPTAIGVTEGFLGLRRGLKPPLATRLLVCQV